MMIVALEIDHEAGGREAVLAQANSLEEAVFHRYRIRVAQADPDPRQIQVQALRSRLGAICVEAFDLASSPGRVSSTTTRV